jgi:hypothetical protein
LMKMREFVRKPQLNLLIDWLQRFDVSIWKKIKNREEVNPLCILTYFVDFETRSM